MQLSQIFQLQGWGGYVPRDPQSALAHATRPPGCASNTKHGGLSSIIIAD